MSDSIPEEMKFLVSGNRCCFFFSGAHGVREEPRFVTARAGESVILGCDVSPPLDGQQPPYVVEWFKFGVPIPFFINFRFYPPHVDPEYAGKMVKAVPFRLQAVGLGIVLMILIPIPVIDFGS